MVGDVLRADGRVHTRACPKPGNILDHIFGHVDLIPECKKTWGRRDEEKWKMASCDCSKIAEKRREICPAVMKHCGKHGWGSFLFSRRWDETKGLGKWAIGDIGGQFDSPISNV